MGIHAVSYYDEPDTHELVDVDYQCSYFCMTETLEKSDVGISLDTTNAGSVNTNDGGSISWGAWPCGEETDYDVHCSSCETLLWRGLQSEVAD